MWRGLGWPRLGRRHQWEGPGEAAEHLPAQDAPLHKAAGDPKGWWCLVEEPWSIQRYNEIRRGKHQEKHAENEKHQEEGEEQPGLEV